MRIWKCGWLFTICFGRRFFTLHFFTLHFLSENVGVALVEVDPGEDFHGGSEGVAALGDDEVDGL